MKRTAHRIDFVSSCEQLYFLIIYVFQMKYSHYTATRKIFLKGRHISVSYNGNILLLY